MKVNGADRFFVITGGPGSGKTSLITALRNLGFACSNEVGRQIIKEQMEISGRALPWIDPQHFAEMMLRREMLNYEMLSAQPGIAFFDRGVPDVIGYLALLGLAVPFHMKQAAHQMRYNRGVFIAPPWPEIFTQDAERKQTWEEAERTYQSMVRTYMAYGYSLLEVPRAPVETRVAFICTEIEKS